MDTNNLALMPVMDISLATDRRNAIISFTKSILVESVDFGVIPGTAKPTLLKPGAEKLTTFFGLSKRFQIIEKIEDWTGADHNGELFFYYLYRCSLYRGDLLIAESDGSCNSFEPKYRWRKGERVCPNCGQPAIIKGKEEYGGGWLCFAKKGGCGAKFKAGSPEIEDQPVGRVPNPDIADQVNTFQKMAQKRALVAATLLAVNASEFFTQDVEDWVEGEVVQTETRQETQEYKPAKPENKPAAKQPAQPVTTNKKLADTPMTKYWAKVRELNIEQSVGAQILKNNGGDAVKAFDELTGVSQPALIETDPQPQGIGAAYDDNLPF